jgi:hypothetical protein
VKITEADVVSLLRQRFTKSGNGGSGTHAFLAQVRNKAGFEAERTFDAVAIDLWPSRGLTIEIFEVKCTRTDWQSELANPLKAEAACAIADRFTIVAPKGCVKPEELPHGWGLVEVLGDGEEKPWRLVSQIPAARLHDEKPNNRLVDRGFLVGLLRSAPGAIPGGKRKGPDQEEIDLAVKAAVASAQVQWERQHERETARMREVLAKVQEFERAAGIQIASLQGYGDDPAALGRAVKVVLSGSNAVEQAQRRIENTQRGLRDAADALEPYLDRSTDGA